MKSQNSNWHGKLFNSPALFYGLYEWNEKLQQCKKTFLRTLQTRYDSASLKRSTHTMAQIQGKKSQICVKPASAISSAFFWQLTWIRCDEKQSTLSTSCHNTLTNRRVLLPTHGRKMRVCHSDWVTEWMDRISPSPPLHPPRAHLSPKKKKKCGRTPLEWVLWGSAAPRQLAVWMKTGSLAPGVGGSGDGVWHLQQG